MAQKLIETVSNLRTEIENLKSASQQEKNDLLQQLSELRSTQKISKEESKKQIENLNQQIKNLSGVSQDEKNMLNSRIAELEDKIDIVKTAEENYKKTIEKLEKDLENSANKLITIISNLEEIEEERDDLLDIVRDLKQSSLTAEKLSNQKIEELQQQVNNLTKTPVEEKEKLKEQILILKTQLVAKVQTETSYQIKIKNLEDNLMSLTNKIKIAVRSQEEEKSRINTLEKELKDKEQDLVKLHEELTTLQNQLNVANDTIEQQNQRISQKNQTLTKLTNQLVDKDKLIVDLQTEIAKLKTPPTFGVKLGTDKDNSKKITTIYSQEDLEKLIKKHQQEVRELKNLIANSAENSQEVKMIQEVPVKEVIRKLPEKNNSSLLLCLLGYSLGTTILGLKLLKKLKSKNKQ